MAVAVNNRTHRAGRGHKESQDERYELRLSGSGGHGVILAAVILAQAIGTNSKMNVVQT